MCCIIIVICIEVPLVNGAILVCHWSVRMVNYWLQLIYFICNGILMAVNQPNIIKLVVDVQPQEFVD